VRFFTDGACENPTNPFFRRSAWAIILDLSKSAEHRSAILQQSASQMEFTNLFQCLGTGLTIGKQSIDRAELTAVVTACRWSVHVARCRATLFTDSQYVINVVNKIRRFGSVVPL
jgi:ribonuclease HI